MYLSTNFQLNEITRLPRDAITDLQVGMMQNITRSILEPLRSFWTHETGEQCPITVTSGLRLPSDTNRLRKLGYHPSETSDHLFGAGGVKLRNAEKVKKYGRFYPYSVGAVDIVPRCGAHKAFNMIRPFFDKEQGVLHLPEEGAIRVGQLIFEKQQEKEWLHISNPVDLIYSFKVAKSLTRGRVCFLTAENGKYERAL